MGSDPSRPGKRSSVRRSATTKPRNTSRKKTGAPADPTVKSRPPWLSDIRRFLEVRDEFAALLGQPAIFKIVVDANIFIRELLWIIEKRKDEKARPALLECLESGTIVAHVTPRILEEVERNMRGLGAERGFLDQAWQVHWTIYLSMLVVSDPDPAVTAKYENRRDPTDAPTLALAETQGMDGIMSSDKDLKAMGGQVLPLKFKLEARDYSRKAAIQVSLQIGGVYLAVGAVEGLIYVAKSLGAAIRGIGRLPGWLKVALTVGALCLAVHPTSRKAIRNSLELAGQTISEATPEMIALVVRLYREYEQVRAKPPVIRYT